MIRTNEPARNKALEVSEINDIANKQGTDKPYNLRLSRLFDIGSDFQ